MNDDDADELAEINQKLAHIDANLHRYDASHIMHGPMVRKREELIARRNALSGDDPPPEMEGAAPAKGSPIPETTGSVEDQQSEVEYSVPGAACVGVERSEAATPVSEPLDLGLRKAMLESAERAKAGRVHEPRHSLPAPVADVSDAAPSADLDDPGSLSESDMDAIADLERSETLATPKPDLAPGCFGMGLYQPGTEVCDSCGFVAQCGPVSIARVAAVMATPGFVSAEEKYNARKRKNSKDFRKRKEMSALPMVDPATALPVTTIPRRRGRPAINGTRMTAVEQKRRWRELQKAGDV